MTKPEAKLRADELLVRQGRAETRSKARALILAGDVRVGDRMIDKPAELLTPATVLEVRAPPPFVSRGGLKLQHALDEFGVDVAGLVAADIGASTGGFTDCLLQRGARRVYAIDVGYGQLDYRLRSDERVVVMERVNARYLEALPEQPALVVIDVSFISLDLILPVAAAVSAPDARVVALIKPQFEAGRGAVARGGVVRDERLRRQTVEHVVRSAAAAELRLGGLTRSPILGPAGNAEFLALLGKQIDALDLDDALDRVFHQS
jgi:23S rRNA (cytidine1920-2'-O)/16S rRNA (cytidine1409-2'-O)-methyltransferase